MQRSPMPPPQQPQSISSPGSTLSLDFPLGGVQRRPHPNNQQHPMAMRPSSGVALGNTNANRLRGHFVGVTSTGAAGDGHQDLGECLLASHTDKSRSAVIVYPEVAWRGAISASAASTTDTVSSSSLIWQQARRQPYTLELVEPCLRRLAGLTTLPSRSFVVAVDLGGQAAHCLRYA